MMKEDEEVRKMVVAMVHLSMMSEERRLRPGRSSLIVSGRGAASLEEVVADDREAGLAQLADLAGAVGPVADHLARVPVDHHLTTTTSSEHEEDKDDDDDSETPTPKER